jgi:hypothetical protein
MLLDTAWALIEDGMEYLEIFNKTLEKGNKMLCSSNISWNCLL